MRSGERARAASRAQHAATSRRQASLDDGAPSPCLADRTHWEKAMGPVLLRWIKRVTLAADLDEPSKLARISLFCSGV